MNRAALEIQQTLRHGLVPAVPVPRRADGTIDEASQAGYAEWMASQPIVGVAVWAHTGRGLKLTESERAGVLAAWRAHLPGKMIIAGAGGNPDAASDVAYIAGARRMATHAASLGADALLAYAPARFRDRPGPEQSSLTLQYHEAIQDAGLPMMLFYLYNEAGGISYTDETLSSLFFLPNVFGIKIATLDSVMTFQHIASLIAQRHPEQLVVTGEDRFLGYSLMMGAEAALVGMGAARTGLQHKLLSAYFEKDYKRFHAISSDIDRFAQVTFANPMEGYIARMLYVLCQDGIIPSESAFDPWGPPISKGERILIDESLIELTNSDAA